MKIILSLFTILFCFNYPMALTITGLYGDVGANSTQTENLLLYAKNQDSEFLEKDFVVFRDSQNSYYIVWGHLDYANNAVTGDDVKFIRYYRPDNINSYTYQVGEDDSFILTNIKFLLTSNINGLGISSPTFNDFEYQNDMIILSIFTTACVLAVSFIMFRRN